MRRWGDVVIWRWSLTVDRNPAGVYVSLNSAPFPTVYCPVVSINPTSPFLPPMALISSCNTRILQLSAIDDQIELCECELKELLAGLGGW
jgi:hypothetical protein